MNNKARRKHYKTLHDERMGETRANRFNKVMWITDYRDSHNITVQLEDGYTVNTTYYYFVRGAVTSPYDRTVFGKGYLGEGNYVTKVNGVVREQYVKWKDMLRRCYSAEYQMKEPAYKGCTVCDEWHNYQVFAQWYDRSKYPISAQRMEVDKDLLFKGNKIYSPDKCCIVPKSLNTLLINRKRARGAMPIGVVRNGSRYEARCSNGRGMKYLGRFKTPLEAFAVYKEYKEKHIKEIANEYKGIIPSKVYNALINYTVDIDD